MSRRMGTAGLGIGQTFIVLLGFLVTSVLIFLFGIWVGRDVVERRMAQEERVVRLAVPTPRQEEVRQPPADAAFFQDMKRKGEDRLRATTAAASPTALPVVPAAFPTVAWAAATPTAAMPAPTRTLPPPTQRPTARTTPTRIPTPRGPAPEKEAWADAGWTVQVNATVDVREAREMMASLRSKGYDAYLVPVPLRGQVWYRVRVGRLANRQKAKELEERLRHSEGMAGAYVTPQ